VPAPIVVEVYAPQPRPPELAVLIAACSRAAAPNECVTSDVKSTEPTLGVAIVRRDRERARIELGLRGAPNAEWSTRDLVFQPGDDELERYRAIGFAIGTLAARQAESEPAAPVVKAEPPPPVVKPAVVGVARPEPPIAPRRGERRTWLDVSGRVGLGLVPGPPRAGAALRAASELLPHGLFAAVEGGYAERVSGPALRVRWVTLGAGLGHSLTPELPSLGVDARLMVAVERLSATAVEGERSATDSRWKPGVLVELDGHWELASPVALLVGASTFIDPKPTAVRSGGAAEGESPLVGLSGFVGVRIRLR
jgi:hypothetical protein